MCDIDTRLFRNALGAFATGVAVVTALDPQDKPVGLTINSFASLSLNPPLVLWSIDQHSIFYQQFFQASHYCIHVLREDMLETSNHFTKATDDLFDNIPFESGIADLPLLPDYTARFQCKVEHRYAGGDHVILVGKVLDMQHIAAKPLVFHAGQYARLSESTS